MEPEYFKYIGKWVTDKDWRLDSYCLVTKIENGRVYYSEAFDFREKSKDNDYWMYRGNLKIVETSELIKKAKEYGHDLKSLGLEEKNDYSQYIGQWVTYSGWYKNSYCLVKEIKNNLLHFSVGFVGAELEKDDCWDCLTPKRLQIISHSEMAKILQQFGHTGLIDTILPECVKEGHKKTKDLIIEYPFSEELNTLPEIKLNNKQFKF